ncbi:MAG TPA: YHS domain-containing (seleno)protein [Microvirga sp.]|jgi:YHS domain-containing protein|nr:YHS domain-containing (seleno)protein [Microvirga sp.]
MLSLSRRSAIAILVASASPSRAQQGKAPRINILEGGRLAIHGYDPVAYFHDGEPRRGHADLIAEYGGALWRFASAANRSRFLENHRRYTPVYGGYCSYGVSRGYLVAVDPAAWTILNDRLYLNFDLAVRRKWLRDPNGYIARADVNWPDLVAPEPSAAVQTGG